MSPRLSLTTNTDHGGRGAKPLVKICATYFWGRFSGDESERPPFHKCQSSGVNGMGTRWRWGGDAKYVSHISVGSNEIVTVGGLRWFDMSIFVV